MARVGYCKHDRLRRTCWECNAERTAEERKADDMKALSIGLLCAADIAKEHGISFAGFNELCAQAYFGVLKEKQS